MVPERKKVTNSSRSKLRIYIPGVQEDDEKVKADAVKKHANLHAYLPAKDLNWVFPLLTYLTPHSKKL